MPTLPLLRCCNSAASPAGTPRRLLRQGGGCSVGRGTSAPGAEREVLAAAGMESELISRSPGRRSDCFLSTGPWRPPLFELRKTTMGHCNAPARPRGFSFWRYCGSASSFDLIASTTACWRYSDMTRSFLRTSLSV
ncbi:unnamed protein product [Linum trigynum]|uniref:Uncharacterized protein n=1 Tax=Linum trigynum TaxID=586398 RepID=A0AAV2FEZ1_9ROSI